MTSEAFVADHSSHLPTAPDVSAPALAEGPKAEPTDVSKAMDTVNLERALIDFEIANARVIDLTARLTNFSTELLATRSELGLAKVRIAELEAAAAELATVKGSAAYRLLRKLGDSRAKLTRR